TLGRRERRAGIDHRRAAVRLRERQRHGAVACEKRAAILIQRLGHFELAAGELLVSEARTLLENQDADAVAYERRELLAHRAPARPGADDDDVVRVGLAHRLASQPRGSAR